MIKGKAQVNKRQKAQLRADNTAGAEQTAAPSLRASLEPGHSRPDSAIYHSTYGDYEKKSVFSYKGDTIIETTYDKGYYVYNPEEDYYIWVETDTWYLPDYQKEEYVFDTNGNILFYCNTGYENYILSWGDKEEYAYNANGTPLSVKYFDFENDEWVLYYEQIYLYDANGMLTGGSIINYDEGIPYPMPMTVSGTVENLEITIVVDGMVLAKFVHHYDPATMRELASESYYLSDEGVLELGMAFEYTYDAAGRLILELGNESDYYFWKTEYAYNANGKKISETDYRGGETINDPYILDDKTEYEYANNRLAKIMVYNYYNNENGELYSTTTFYYGNGSSILSPEAAKVLGIYAADGYLTFDLPVQTANATLQLIDLTGRTVLKAQAVSGKPVAIPSLRGGVYIYRIIAESTTYNGKIIIK
ncbi:hypothetical protein AGMMS50239_18510 [Bacteroidia bacterium]|nr:hypothetical protein AGMMS50239_18510 [Bacteroidia bacterium]